MLITAVPPIVWWNRSPKKSQLRRSPVLIRIAIFVCLGAGQLALGQVYASDLPLNHPSIDYQGSTILDGDSPLPREAGLAGLLERLGINVDTQVLVFSKTSVQAPRISPRNPRATYF